MTSTAFSPFDDDSDDDAEFFGQTGGENAFSDDAFASEHQQHQHDVFGDSMAELDVWVATPEQKTRKKSSSTSRERKSRVAPPPPASSSSSPGDDTVVAGLLLEEIAKLTKTTTSKSKSSKTKRKENLEYYNHAAGPDRVEALLGTLKRESHSNNNNNNNASFSSLQSHNTASTSSSSGGRVYSKNQTKSYLVEHARLRKTQKGRQVSSKLKGSVQDSLSKFLDESNHGVPKPLGRSVFSEPVPRQEEEKKHKHKSSSSSSRRHPSSSSRHTAASNNNNSSSSSRHRRTVSGDTSRARHGSYSTRQGRSVSVLEEDDNDTWQSPRLVQDFSKKTDRKSHTMRAMRTVDDVRSPGTSSRPSLDKHFLRSTRTSSNNSNPSGETASQSSTPSDFREKCRNLNLAF